MPKLFKFISFQSDFWHQPLAEEKLYFASTQDLRNPNDPLEFVHRWEYNSKFFQKFKDHFKDHYNSLFEKTRILCLTTERSNYCWKEFSKEDGICYEFDFSHHNAASDIFSREVEYGEKELNVPSYIIAFLEDERLKKLITKKFTLLPSQLGEIRDNFEAKTPQIFINHILNELSLKKTMPFRQEKEYRFVHLEPGFGETEVIVLMPEGKVSFQELGLSLVKIHTSDTAKVRTKFPNCDIEVVLFE